MVEMQSARLKRADAARHLLEARDFSRVRLHELETEITNLQNGGYVFDSSENDDSAEVHVLDSDIYYEWYITESTIR